MAATQPTVNQPSEQGIPKRDFRQEVTDNIVQMLEKGVAPWQKPWDPSANSFGMPLNPTTGNAYRGGNAIHLIATALRRGYEDPRWMTYKQAAENGWQVRKGEKGTQIEFWEVKQQQAKTTAPTPADNEQNSGKPERAEARRLIHRVYTVFNAAQIEGVPAHEPKRHSAFEAVRAGEQMLQNSGANIVHDQADRAFYSRASDSIHLPPKDSFKTAPGYYGTALHELSHWSGHPSRLNRSTLTESYRFGDVNYAKEELRAELASVFIAAERGIPHDPEQHAAYVGSWIKSLKEDKNEIFRAAHDASAAADFLLGLERDRSIAEESLQAETVIDPSGDTSPAVPEIEQETAKLDRDREQLDETVPEPSGPNAFRPGDKIIAHEPYYYGGRPKKNPETPAIVQSLYSNGSMVSYMRMNDRENGNKSLGYGDMRHATLEDLRRYSAEFAALEQRFRESSTVTARFEPGSGTINVHDKQQVKDRRTVIDAYPTPSNGTQQHNGSPTKEGGPLGNERAVATAALGNNARTYLAQVESGTYRGQVLGQTPEYIVQRVSSRSAIAHPKDSFDRQLTTGENVVINYSGGKASVRDFQQRTRDRQLSR